MIKDVVFIMLKYFNYEINNQKNDYILAKKNDEELWIFIDSSNDITLLDEFVEFLNGKNGLYIILKNMNCNDNSQLEKLKKETGVIIWDLDRFANIIGSFLMETLDKKKIIQLIGLSVLKVVENNEETNIL